MTSLWTRCNNCQRILYKQDILENLAVCPACGIADLLMGLIAQNQGRILIDETELVPERMKAWRKQTSDMSLKTPFYFMTHFGLTSFGQNLMRRKKKFIGRWD